ncbi:hypothetical protein ACQPYA_02245 [Micromonospora sp. CA-263727]|uniref:hypothetical protein n=1 Tax=Micromonospora sp. CA-263727 TaxID=3239967 RepID=UPI003D8B2121
MTQRVRAHELREAIANALYHLKSYQLPKACARYGLAPGDDDEAYASKKWYVLRRIEEWDTPQLVTLAVRILEDHADDALQQLVNRAGARGVVGDFKNLIFAADGPKPELVLRDAVNNVIEIVKHGEHCLVYDRPLPADGLSWAALVRWWCEAQGMPPGDELIYPARLLFKRLARSLASEPERRFFRAYHDLHGPHDMDRVPALIPQVYLHYDPYTQRSRQATPGPLPRQRMDFLMLLPQDQRIVIEIDGKQHYADETGRAQPRLYAEMVSADRLLRLAGYEMYRFGGYELCQDQRSADEVVAAFFRDLFDRHSINPAAKPA